MTEAEKIDIINNLMENIENLQDLLNDIRESSPEKLEYVDYDYFEMNDENVSYMRESLLGEME